MNYSTEYVAQVVVLLGFALKLFKVEIATEELTSIVSAIFVIGGSAYTLCKRYARGKAGIQPEVTVLGFKK